MAPPVPQRGSAASAIQRWIFSCSAVSACKLYGRSRGGSPRSLAGHHGRRSTDVASRLCGFGVSHALGRELSGAEASRERARPLSARQHVLPSRGVLRRPAYRDLASARTGVPRHLSRSRRAHAVGNQRSFRSPSRTCGCLATSCNRPPHHNSARHEAQPQASFRRFGVDSVAAWLERLRAFRIGDALHDIRCPSLALVGEGEGPVAMDLFASFSRGMSGPVTQRVFTTAEGADSHCQLGNLPLSNAVVYDWLDEVFT